MRRVLFLTMMNAGGVGVATPTATLVDTYADAHAAGSLTATLATDGVNTRTVVDTTNKLATTANGLEVTSITGTADPAIRYNSQALTIGRAIFARIKIVSGTANWIVGWDSDGSGLPQDGFRFSGTSLICFIRGNGLTVSTFSTGVTYDVAIVHRNPGVICYRRGGADTDWTTWFISALGSDASLFPYLGAGSSGGGTGAASDYITLTKACVLAQQATQYAGVSAMIATTVSGDTIAAASGNTIIEHTITAATGVTQELMVRRTDDNNTLIIRMDQGASKIYLYEKSAGVETEIGATGGIAQTWTDATQYRIHVRMSGTSVIVVVDSTVKQSTTSTLNNSVTGAKVSRAGVNLIAWPVNPTGAVKTEMDLFFP